eukprot:2570760-Pyramimonas_sp.AAC.1
MGVSKQTCACRASASRHCASGGTPSATGGRRAMGSRPEAPPGVRTVLGAPGGPLWASRRTPRRPSGPPRESLGHLWAVAGACC